MTWREGARQLATVVGLARNPALNNRPSQEERTNDACPPLPLARLPRSQPPSHPFHDTAMSESYEELSYSERVAIVSKFIERAPPGEVNDVVNGLYSPL